MARLDEASIEEVVGHPECGSTARVDVDLQAQLSLQPFNCASHSRPAHDADSGKKQIKKGPQSERLSPKIRTVAFYLF